MPNFINSAKELGVQPEDSNPCRDVTKCEANNGECCLTAHDFSGLGALLDRLEVEGNEVPFVIAATPLLSLTGARPNEILTARWPNAEVDVDRALLLPRDLKAWQKTV